MITTRHYLCDFRYYFILFPSSNLLRQTLVWCLPMDIVLQLLLRFSRNRKTSRLKWWIMRSWNKCSSVRNSPKFENSCDVMELLFSRKMADRLCKRPHTPFRGSQAYFKDFLWSIHNCFKWTTYRKPYWKCLEKYSAHFVAYFFFLTTRCRRASFGLFSR